MNLKCKQSKLHFFCSKCLHACKCLEKTKQIVTQCTEDISIGISSQEKGVEIEADLALGCSEREQCHHCQEGLPLCQIWRQRMSLH